MQFWAAGVKVESGPRCVRIWSPFLDKIARTQGDRILLLKTLGSAAGSIKKGFKGTKFHSYSMHAYIYIYMYTHICCQVRFWTNLAILKARFWTKLSDRFWTKVVLPILVDSGMF